MHPFLQYGTFLGAITHQPHVTDDPAHRNALATAIELRSPLTSAYMRQHWVRLMGERFVPELVKYSNQLANVRPLGVEPLPYAVGIIAQESEAVILDALLHLRQHPALQDEREGVATWPARLQFEDWRCFVNAIYAKVVLLEEKSDPQAPIHREATKVLEGNIAVLALTYPDNDFTPAEVHAEWHVIIRLAAGRYAKTFRSILG